MATKKTSPVAEPATPPQKHLRIVAMQAENIKRLSFVRIRPKGNVVTIAGENGSGKTSVLDSIAWALTGTSDIPSQPIKKGKGFGKIEVDLGEYKVTRHFTRVEGGKEPFITRLDIEGRNREKFRSPQDLINQLKGVISFDPLAFINMEDKKQLETLRQLVTLDIDLEAHDGKRKAAYDERRDVGRDLDGAKARLKATPVPPEDLPHKPIDTAEINSRLLKATGEENKRQQIIDRKRKLENQAQSVRDSVARMQQEAAELRKRADELSRRAEEENAKGLALDEEDAKIKVPEPTDTKEMLAELSQANVTNSAIARATQYRAIEKEVKATETKWEGLDKQVKDLDAERAASIARAKMPIDKLGIGDGEVLYDGLPFSQASNAEQIRISVALAIASNPQLRVLRIMDGALLDKKSMDLITQMANEHDFQIWIERVEAGGKVGVTMVDGEASGEDVEPAK